ncbi:hypothetical protein [Methanococcoides sp. FTZ1]|uniref:hypothetical protein n=1 Tax=Methanococcoides sp. FTZ1 TaxID=3439061 RepID=UPI003F8456E0
MKRGTTKGIVIIAAVLMVASVLSITALADNGNGSETAPGPLEKNNPSDTFDPVQDRDRDTDRDMDMDRDRDRDFLRIQNRTNIQDAKNDYNKMTSEFQTIKNNQARGLLTSEEMFNASKDYLNGTIDYMIIRLENIKDEGDYPEDVNETIDDYIDKLELIRVDVEDAETREELSDALKEIRDLWKDTIADIRSSNEMKIGERLDDHIANANRISERLQNEIREMEQNGQDVKELQEMLDEYNKLIAEAESLQEEGEIEDAIDKTREANEKLRELLQEMKQFRKGFVNMAGEGPFNAEGDGTIVLSGQLNVTISATDAMLVIKDLSGDAEIDITGEYDLVNEEKDDDCCAFVYDDFTGDATINGTRLTIMIRGEDMTIFAEGSGSSSLSGEGTYHIGEGDEALEMEFADDDDSDEEEEEEEEEEEIELESEDESVNDDEEDGDNSEEDDSSEDDENN